MTDNLHTSTPLPVDIHELNSVVEGRHGSPHSILGPHPHDGAVTVRAFKPLASSVVVRYRVDDDWRQAELSHEHDGVWVGVVPVADVPDYRLLVTYGDHTSELDDPYRFLPTVGEVDQHLIREGRHEQLWKVLGARVHHDEEDRPSGKVLVAGGQLDRGRHDVVRRDVVADVDERGVGTQPEDDALHRAGVVVRRAEVREQRDDRP